MNDSVKLQSQVVVQPLPLLAVGMGDVLKDRIAIRVFLLGDSPKVYVRNRQGASYVADVEDSQVLSYINNRDLVCENEVFYSVTKSSDGEVAGYEKAPIPVYKESIDGMEPLAGLLGIAPGKLFKGSNTTQTAQDRAFHYINGEYYVVVRSTSGKEYYEACTTVEMHTFAQIGDFHINGRSTGYCYGNRPDPADGYFSAFTPVQISLL